MARRTKISLTLWALLVSLEALAVFVAYETLGWMESDFFVVVFVVTDPMLLAVQFYATYRRALAVGFVVLLLLCSFIAPLSIRWYFVDKEAKRIATWAESQKLETGRYPEDLSGYVFLHPRYKEYVDYFADEYVGFGVSYTVGTPNTNHHYDPDGGWYYQDD